jgi:mannan endo-1,4-beta-mannosidase
VISNTSRTALIPFLLLTLLAPALLHSENPAASKVTVKRAEVLKFIASLSGAKTFRGAISGQNCFHGDEIADDSYQRGYRTMIEALHEKTGKWPGILGLDYEWARCFTSAQLTKANAFLIDYARAGGIIAVTFTPQNPWYNDESDLKSNPGSPTGPSGTVESIPSGASLNDLLDPSKPVSAAWNRKLNRIAGALKELCDAGAIVLFRPMQEMNGNWFWWGIASHLSNPAPYVRVFRSLYDFFTREKGLNNLIWVYSPVSTYGNDTRSSSVFRPVDWAYPGDGFVDIVAGTNYADDMSIADYAVYARMGKPLGIAEYGPVTNGPFAKNGTWDTSRIIERIRTDYPMIAFWVCWHSYKGENWSIVSNLNASTLMNSPFVIDRDDLKWSY